MLHIKERLQDSSAQGHILGLEEKSMLLLIAKSFHSGKFSARLNFQMPV